MVQRNNPVFGLLQFLTAWPSKWSYIQNLRSSTKISLISKTIQDRVTVSAVRQYELSCAASNGVISNDIE